MVRRDRGPFVGSIVGGVVLGAVVGMLGGGIILVLAGVWVIARNFFASGSGPPLAEVLLVSPVYYLVGGAAIGGAIGYLRARKRPKASAETPVRPDPR